MDILEHVETLRTRLAATALTREQLADLSGGSLSVSWLSKFASGKMRNPRVESLLSLERALDAAQTPRAA